MIDKRKSAFDNISRTLAIIRYDIEQHQVINDLSLNIHGENYFRDIFNYVYAPCKLENANFDSANSPCVDLVDKGSKLAYQITTTKTKAKIENTLVALQKPEYQGYRIKLFFLLGKATLKKETITEINARFNVNIIDCLHDHKDLIKDINNLETTRLIGLNKRYFESQSGRYTDEIVLDLIFRHLIGQKSTIKPMYNDDFGNVDSHEKLKLNNINNRIASEINKGLDYRDIVESISQENNLLTTLRGFVVDELYKTILMAQLHAAVRRSELESKSLAELHGLARQYAVCFNKTIYKLHEAIEAKMDIKDFNAMNIAWIIIAYFFELCDVGVHES